MGIRLVDVVTDISRTAGTPLGEEDRALTLSQTLRKTDYGVVVPIDAAPGRVRYGVSRLIANIGNRKIGR